jgi:hypothetical protein
MPNETKRCGFCSEPIVFDDESKTWAHTQSDPNHVAYPSALPPTYTTCFQCGGELVYNAAKSRYAHDEPAMDQDHAPRPQYLER